jgi:hypothetical protein
MNEKKLQAMIMLEFIKATKKFDRFNSMHEGYAVVKEEVEEMWDEIKKNNRSNAILEAVQVGAMALRFLYDAMDAKTWEILLHKYEIKE